MSYKLAFGLAAALCLAVTITHAQTVDSAIDKLTNFPSKLFSRINGQAAALNQQPENKPILMPLSSPQNNIISAKQGLKHLP